MSLKPNTAYKFVDKGILLAVRDDLLDAIDDSDLDSCKARLILTVKQLNSVIDGQGEV